MDDTNRSSWRLEDDESAGFGQTDEMPHSERVRIFRYYIGKEEKAHQGALTPLQIIHEELYWRSVWTPSKDKIRKGWFYTLLLAWYALSYEHCKPGSSEEFKAHHRLRVDYKLSVKYGYEPTDAVPLDPIQAEVIDALAEIASIPHNGILKTAFTRVVNLLFCFSRGS